MVDPTDKNNIIMNVLQETALKKEKEGIDSYKQLKDRIGKEKPELQKQIEQVIQEEKNHQKTLQKILRETNLKTDQQTKELTLILNSLLKEIESIALYKFITPLIEDNELQKEIQKMAKEEKKHARTYISLLEQYRTNIKQKEINKEIIIDL
ncbi:ferritin family protein [Methanonatronarchaeum sp. AMET6-2]|uniref:ferritin family protein n=1 Tax=Methanonatronarchaeum sp. AMET6-2 TaxID=2933293 RepID=UPI00122B057D|nr:ferritin family protein [Methanonatronarchaeum sp. AMET6-2]RZN61463.1 MAG: hypothetical protein EF811_05080 [Methanonatronarchaeia archaeon]UOY09968.1 hypothetical protein MU439_06825 [Methanonatronarchaeum sp. AMET6-2]